MSTILLAIFTKFKSYILSAAAGAAILGSLLFATRRKTPDFSAQNEENKQANTVSQAAEVNTGEKINETTDKTAAAVNDVRNSDSLRDQREVVAKAVDDAND